RARSRRRELAAAKSRRSPPGWGWRQARPPSPGTSGPAQRAVLYGRRRRLPPELTIGSTRVRMARTISIANQKGGVGKTATAVNPGAALAEAEQRVLLIDLDAQAHLTINMGVKTPDDIHQTIYHLLVDPETTINDVVQVNESMGVHYVPANIELAGAEGQLFNEIGREGVLKEKLLPARRRYDFIVIDCRPRPRC